MLNLINYVKSFANQEEGQDLLEYALLVALIALIAIGAVALAGHSVSAIFTNIAGRPLDLTKTEFDVLELLMVNAGIVMSRETIYEHIWGYDFETSSRSLDVYVGYLRGKTEADGASRLVHTVRGVGYVLRP